MTTASNDPQAPVPDDSSKEAMSVTPVSDEAESDSMAVVPVLDEAECAAVAVVAEPEAPDNDAPAKLGDVFKVVGFASLALGVGASVVFAVARVLLSFIPQQFVMPGVLFLAFKAISPLSFIINCTWIKWVTQHGVRWLFPVRLMARMAAIAGVITGFYLFYSIVNPVTVPWVTGLMQQKINGDEELLNDAMATAYQQGSLSASASSGELMPWEKQKLDAVVREKFLEKHNVWIAFVLPIAVGGNTALGALLLWGALVAWNAAERSASYHRKGRATVDDVRGHIAYFRSFKSDAAPAYLEGFWSGFNLKSEEEILAGCAPWGTRFFAIGRPGEPLPELGATRMYFADEDWQAAASAMIRNAALVLIRPHRTPSLVWEFQHIVNSVKPEKFCIWLPSLLEKADWEGFKQAVEQHAHQGLPEFEKVFAKNFVVFDAQWHARAFRIENGSHEMKSFSLHQKPKEGSKLLAAELGALLARAKAAK